MNIKEEFKKILSRYGEFLSVEDISNIMKDCYTLGKKSVEIEKQEKEQEILNYPHEQLKLL